MKKFFQVLMFLLSFQVEVRVRASVDTLQEPAACLKSTESCALHVVGPAFHLKQSSLKLHAGESSTLMRLSQEKWRLVKGVLWVESAPDIQVETAYLKAKSSHGQYWIIERDNKQIVRNIDAELIVELRDGKKLEVPAGFEFWVSGINSKGVSDYGMIQTVDLKDHLSQWNRLFVGSKDQFKSEVAALRSNWSDLTERGASLYEKIALRQLASVDEARRKEDEKRRQAQTERQKIRELMFQRAFDR